MSCESRRLQSVITHLRGTLVSKEPVLVTIDVGGLGYSVH
ncbi:MAG: hypothetical protein IH825_07975, partial [Candidatus Marinimicrobia bacterium]|nr:hypothetical protein [Candidatus Neomarinimicrobiota bacterium]